MGICLKKKHGEISDYKFQMRVEFEAGFGLSGVIGGTVFK